MLRFIRKSIFALLAAITFGVTTLTGAIAGLIGAILRAQLPDEAMTENASQEPDATAPFVPGSPNTPSKLRQPDGAN